MKRPVCSTSLFSQIRRALSDRAPGDIGLVVETTPELVALYNAGFLTRSRTDFLLCPACQQTLVRIERMDIPVENCQYHAYCDVCEEDNLLTISQIYKYGLDEAVLVSKLVEALCMGPHETPGADTACYSLGKSRTTGAHVYYASNPSKVDCLRVRKSETAVLISGSGYTGDPELDRRIVPLDKVWGMEWRGRDYVVGFSAKNLDIVAGGLSAKPRKAQADITKPNRNTKANSRCVLIAGLLEDCIAAASRCHDPLEHFGQPSAREISEALKGSPEQACERTVRRELNRARDTYRQRVGGGITACASQTESILFVIGGILEKWDERIRRYNHRSEKGREMREAQLIKAAGKRFSVQLLKGGKFDIRPAAGD